MSKDEGLITTPSEEGVVHSFDADEPSITDKMSAMGYAKFHGDGICFGASSMAQIDFLHSDITVFDKRLTLIKQTDIGYFSSLADILNGKDDLGGTLPQPISDIIAFFEGVTICQKSADASSVFERKMAQESMLTHPLLWPDTSRAPPKRVKNHLYLYSYDGFAEALSLLETHLLHSSLDKCSFVFNSTDHAIWVGFNRKNVNPWCFFDYNHPSEQVVYFGNAYALAETLFPAFLNVDLFEDVPEEDHQNLIESEDLCIETFYTVNHDDVDVFNQLNHRLEADDAWVMNHLVDVATATKIDGCDECIVIPIRKNTFFSINC